MVLPSMSVDKGMVVAIIQARMTSSRLPGKVLANFVGRPLLEFMLERVGRAQLLDEVWVATTRNATDDPICELCERLEIPFFRGEEADVLSRFVSVAKATGAEVVVRLTADCPFADPEVIDDAVRMLLHAEYDYVSNVLHRSYPDGLDVEAFMRSTLDLTAANSISAFQREHVTPYMRTGAFADAGNFSVGHLMAPANFSNLRWTVDTKADLDHVARLAERLPADCGWMEIISLVMRRPDLMVRGAPALLVLRRAVESDVDILFDWVNRPESLAAKLVTESPILKANHESWFRERLSSSNCRIWIAEYKGRPIGQVRAEFDSSGSACVDVFIEPDARGSGLALAIIDEMARELSSLWSGVRLIARVRLENIGSRRLFDKAGFRIIETKSDHFVMVRALS